MFRKKLVVWGAGIGFLALPAFSQSESAGGNNEVSVQAFGSFVKSTTNGGVSEHGYRQWRRAGHVSLFFQHA
jgi:hypothetical protein